MSADLALQTQLQEAIALSQVSAIDLIRQSQFKSSEVPIPEPIKNYLNNLMEDAFNRYCIDCKTGITTHCLVAYGSFVCRDCAVRHRVEFG